jgi:hypothetical protein
MSRYISFTSEKRCAMMIPGKVSTLGVPLDSIQDLVGRARLVGALVLIPSPGTASNHATATAGSRRGSLQKAKTG